MRSYLDGMLRSFEIAGRSTRRQYWMFFVIQWLVHLGAALIDILLFDGLANPRQPQLPMSLFASFVHFVPGITLQVRRLHDVGRSGFWMLLWLIPFAGLFVLYWNCCASAPGRNAYDDPEPSTYQPHHRRMRATRAEARQPIASTIPRQVRMGNAAPQPGYAGLSAPERFI